MTKIKLTILATVLMSNLVFAQTVQDGRKMIYYERYTSAKDILQKVTAATPTNIEAQYWLGQAMIGLKDIAGAKEVYRKALEPNGSNPLLLVAMGHIELLEGKASDARQRFETAVSMTKGKDIGVFNAIGRASVYSKDGDAAYAIEKLKAATQIKGFKDPETYIMMGDAYRKLQDGSGAVTAYQNALSIDPKYAAASHKIGKVYLTQGQQDLIKKYYEDALAADPAYSPALYDYYQFFFFRDVNRSREFFDRYKANADKSPALDYEEASLSFAASDFKGAISKADALLQAQGANADPRLYRLKGYSYDKLGDSALAAENMQKFFDKAGPDQVVGDNYLILAMALAKNPGKMADAERYMMKAIETDTVVANKIEFSKKMADFYRKAGNAPKAAEWMTKILTINPKPGKVDIYNAGFENFKAGQFQTSDSIFKLYKQNFPDEVYGYYWSFRSLSAIDSTMEKGLAIPDCQKFIELAEKDKVKNKSTLSIAYGYMAGYSANVKKDFPAAIAFLDKILEIDPTNADALSNKQILQKASNNKGTKGGGGGAGNTSAKQGG